MRKVLPWLLAVVVLLLAVILFNLFQPAVVVGSASPPALAYSDLLSGAAAGEVERVVFDGHVLTGTFKDHRRFRTVLPEDPGLASRLAAAGVRVEAADTAEGDAPLLRLVVSWLPLLLYFLMFYVLLRPVSRELRALRTAVEASSRLRLGRDRQDG